MQCACLFLSSDFSWINLLFTQRLLPLFPWCDSNRHKSVFFGPIPHPCSHTRVVRITLPPLFWKEMPLSRRGWGHQFPQFPYLKICLDWICSLIQLLLSRCPLWKFARDTMAKTPRSGWSSCSFHLRDCLSSICLPTARLKHTPCLPSASSFLAKVWLYYLNPCSSLPLPTVVWFYPHQATETTRPKVTDDLFSC